LSPDDRKLTVTGAELGRCISAFQRVESTGTGQPEEVIDCLRSFERDILEAAAKVRRSTLRDVLKEWLQYHMSPSHFTSDLDTALQGYEAAVHSPEGNAATSLYMPNLYSLRGPLITGSYFVLSNGTIGKLDRWYGAVQLGDILSLLKGSDKPSLLRPCGSEFLFIGSCELKGSSTKMIYYEFFSGHEMTTFTLI
jgi:hypothetical protein